LKSELKADVIQHNTLVDEFKRLKPAGPQQAPRRKQVADTIKQCRRHFEQNKEAVMAAEREMDALLGQLCVVATRTLYPGTRVTLLEDVFNTSREHGPTKVIFDESDLKAEALKK
jgi:uncharacterized protein (DUF342 family)